MNHQQPLCAAMQAKIHEQIERTEHLIRRLPENCTDWVPAISGAWSVGFLLGHLLDCLAGFCAVLYAVAPERLGGLVTLRDLPVNHACMPAEAAGRIPAYLAALDEGFATIRDADLALRVSTVFVKNG